MSLCHYSHLDSEHTVYDRVVEEIDHKYKQDSLAQ
jgi:hypothetical protein